MTLRLKDTWDSNWSARHADSIHVYRENGGDPFIVERGAVYCYGATEGTRIRGGAIPSGWVVYVVGDAPSVEEVRALAGDVLGSISALADVHGVTRPRRGVVGPLSEGEAHNLVAAIKRLAELPPLPPLPQE